MLRGARPKCMPSAYIRRGNVSVIRTGAAMTTTWFLFGEKTRLGEVSFLAIKAQPSTPAISAKLRRGRRVFGGVFFGLEETSGKLSAGGGRTMDDGDVERKGHQLEGFLEARSQAWPDNFCGGELHGRNDASHPCFGVGGGGR